MGIFTININQENINPIVQDISYNTEADGCRQVTFKVIGTPFSEIIFECETISNGNHGFFGGIYKTDSSYNNPTLLGNFVSSTGFNYDINDTLDESPATYYLANLCARPTIDPPNDNSVQVNFDLKYNNTTIDSFSLIDVDSN